MSAPSQPRTGRFEYFFDRSNYMVVPSGTITVTVFIRETFHPATDESLLLAGTDGLVRGGVVIQVGDPLPPHPAFVRTTAAILGNTKFDLAVVAQAPTPERPDCAGIVALSNHPVFGEVVSRSHACETVQLPLGTFTFTAGNVVGEATFLTALVPDDLPRRAGGHNVTESGVILDPLLRTGGATITVAAKLPAPKSNAAAGAADLLAAMYGSRKRRT